MAVSLDIRLFPLLRLKLRIARCDNVFVIKCNYLRFGSYVFLFHVIGSFQILLLISDDRFIRFN